MTAFRLILRHHRLAAAMLFAAALALRIFVPGGFMPMTDHGRIVVKICAGALDGVGAMVMPGAHYPDTSDRSAQGRCAYADLALAMTGGADPVQLNTALIFVLALAIMLAVALPARTANRLRPPLRGPPLPA